MLWILEWPSSTEYAMCGVTRVHRCPAISTAIHYSAALRDGQEAVLTDDSVSPATRRHPLGDQQMYPSSILTWGLSPELTDALFDQPCLVKIRGEFSSRKKTCRGLHSPTHSSQSALEIENDPRSGKTLQLSLCSLCYCIQVSVGCLLDI